MTWMFYALLAPAIDTLIVYIDRFVIEREVKDYRGLAVFGSLIGAIAGTLFWIASGFHFVRLQDAFIILLTGMFNLWGSALYYKSLYLEETSRIIIFFKAIPVFILALSFIFLREGISLQQCLGFAVVLTAVVGVSLFGRGQSYTNLFSKGLFLILTVDVLWSVSAVLAKFVIDQYSFTTLLVYESWGIGIGGAVLFFVFGDIRRAFFNTIQSVSRRGLSILVLNEGLYILSKSITFFAYSLGPPALVSVVGGIQVFYGIFSGAVLTLISPAIFHEDIRRQTIIRKLLFATLLIAGIYLVT